LNSIKKARLAKGMTIAQLASAVGVSCAAICRYEKGVRNPKLSIVVKMAQVLDVKWYQLIDVRKAG